MLRETIAQYINIIKGLTNQLNNKKMEQEIIDVLLINQANFDSAKAISTTLDSLKRTMNEFWSEVQSNLKEEIGQKPTWFHPKEERFSLSINTDIEETFFTIEPLKGIHYSKNEKYKNLYIAIFSKVLEKNNEKEGPNVNLRKMEFLPYNFDSHETLSKIFTSKSTREKVIRDITESVVKYFFSSEINHYLYDSKVKAPVIIDKILSFRNQLVNITSDKKWWHWQGWVVGFSFHGNELPTIGVEGNYREVNGDQFAEFEIHFITWDTKAWTFYEKTLKDAFPKSQSYKIDEKNYLIFETIPGGDEQLILSKLSECFNYLKLLNPDKILPNEHH